MIVELTSRIAEVTANLDEPLLAGAGIGLVLPGLTIWLAGLGMGRISTAAVGFIAGFVLGHYITHRIDLMLWLWPLGGAVVMLAIEYLLSRLLGFGSFAYNLALSIFFAMTGTAMLFFGMILLLIYKGAEPLDLVINREQMFLVIILAMIAFATVEQMTLCSKVQKNLVRARPPKKDTEQEPQERKKWRGR